MNSNIQDLMHSVRYDKKHFYIVGGNIFDNVFLGASYPNFIRFLHDLTPKKFPNFISFDLFSGIEVLRGDKEIIMRANRNNFAETQARNSNQDAITRAFEQINAAQGLAQQNDASLLSTFRTFDRLLHEPLGEKTIIVIQYADIFFQSANGAVSQFDLIALQTALHKWALDEDIHKNGHAILCLGKRIDEAASILLDRCGCVHQLRIPKPSQEEICEYLICHLRVSEERAKLLGRSCAGLSFKEVQRMYLSLDESSDEEALDCCFRAKKSVLQEEYGDVLEVMGSSYGFDAIGGLEKPIKEMKQIARAMREGKTALVPQGMAFFGPPGTGKTILMQATAKEAGVNAVRARDLKNMFLGESERLKTRFLNALKDVAPVIVLVDELDQAYKERGSYDGDSGVSKDAFKKDLEIMSDPSLRGKVLFVFASNHPDLVDSALKRAGRCDLRIPFPPFRARELAKICKAALVQFPEIKTDITDFLPFLMEKQNGKVVEKYEGYSGADMVEVIRRAWKYALYDEREKILHEDMEWALKDYIPQKADEFEIARMTLLAFRECSSMSLLPDNWKELHEKYGRILMEHSGSDDIDSILYPSRSHARIMTAR